MNDSFDYKLKDYILSDRVLETLSLLGSYLENVNLDEATLFNNDNNKYYIIEDGTIFKFLKNEYSFYRLNLINFSWEYDPSLITIYNDAFLKFQEISNFKDYFLDANSRDFNSGRHL